MRSRISTPSGNERGPQCMEQALRAIHQANPSRLPLTLELCRHANEVTLAGSYPDALGAIVESQLYAQYPDARMLAVKDERTACTCSFKVELHLHNDLFPIRRYAQFEDPLNRVTADPL